MKLILNDPNHRLNELVPRSIKLPPSEKRNISIPTFSIDRFRNSFIVAKVSSCLKELI